MLTAPNQSVANKYIPNTPKNSAAASGGGGSWGPKKPSPFNTGALGGQPTNTPMSSNANFTQQNANPFSAPSAWSNQGTGKTIVPPTADAPAIVKTIRPTVTTSAPGATGTTPTQITSPAGQNYIQSQLESMKTQANNIASQIPGATGYSGTQGTGTQGTGTTAPTKTESEYIKYLRSMFNPEEARVAQENVNSLNKMTADEIARTRKETDKIRKNEIGMLESGQDYSLATLDRESSKALADLAIAKGYSTDILNQYTQAGATLYEAEEAMRLEAETPISIEAAQALGLPYGTTFAEARAAGKIPAGSSSEGFTLGKDQSRYDAQGNLIASTASEAGGAQDPMTQYRLERANRITSGIDEALADTNIWTAGFLGAGLKLIPGTPAYNLKATIDKITSNIGFEELSAMRQVSPTGGALGQVAIQELEMLQSVLGSLKTNQSPEKLKQNLLDIKTHYTNWQNAVNAAGAQGGGEVVQTSAGAINTNW